MKTKIVTIILALFCLTIPNACGGSASNSKWLEKDKQNAINACKFGFKNQDPAKVEKRCQCYLEKVMALSPDPVKQGDIPRDEVTKLNKECDQVAGF